MSLRLSSSWQGRSLLRDDLGPPELLLGDLLPRAGGPRPIVSSNASSAGSGTVGIVYVSIDIYFKTNDRLYPVCYGVGEGEREGGGRAEAFSKENCRTSAYTVEVSTSLLRMWFRIETLQM